jgi:hypothetical protein
VVLVLVLFLSLLLPQNNRFTDTFDLVGRSGILHTVLNLCKGTVYTSVNLYSVRSKRKTNNSQKDGT